METIIHIYFECSTKEDFNTEHIKYTQLEINQSIKTKETMKSNHIQGNKYDIVYLINCDIESLHIDKYQSYLKDGGIIYINNLTNNQLRSITNKLTENNVYKTFDLSAYNKSDYEKYFQIIKEKDNMKRFFPLAEDLNGRLSKKILLLLINNLFWSTAQYNFNAQIILNDSNINRICGFILLFKTEFPESHKFIVLISKIDDYIKSNQKYSNIRNMYNIF